VRRDLKVYGFAIFTSLWAALLTHWISPVLGNTFFEFFHVAVVLSAFFGGLGPGILAATLCFFVIDYFFILPLNQFVLGPHLIRLIIFEAVAILTSLLSGKLKESTEFLRNATRELEKSILEINSREQRRLGQDLHDGICQTLAGTRLLVENIKKSVTPSVRADLESVESSLSDALTQADGIARGLHPVELEASGLTAALSELAQKTSRIYSMDCSFSSETPVAIGSVGVATHLFRITQEAEHHAAKRQLRRSGRELLKRHRLILERGFAGLAGLHGA
jgi:signal transduction histidine kinase